MPNILQGTTPSLKIKINDGLIDKSGEQLDLWKVDQTPMVYHYQIPFTWRD